MALGPPKELLTAWEVCAYLRISRSKLYRLCRKGKVPALRLGQELRYKREDIERLLLTYDGVAPPADDVQAWTTRLAEVGPDAPLPVDMLLSIPDEAFVRGAKGPPAFQGEHAEIVKLADGLYQISILYAGEPKAVLDTAANLYLARRVLCDALWIKLVERPAEFDEEYVEALRRASLTMYDKQMLLDLRVWRKALARIRVAKEQNKEEH